MNYLMCAGRFTRLGVLCLVLLLALVKPRVAANPVPADTKADGVEPQSNEDGRAPMELKSSQLFFKTGTDVVADFTSVSNPQQFDVVNTGFSYLMVVFEPNANATLSPRIVRLGPAERQTVTISAGTGAKSFSLSYAVSYAPTPFKTHSDRYRAYSDGETVMIIPVRPSFRVAIQVRAASIVEGSKEHVTDSAVSGGTFISTPGPFYRAAGLFARDFLYQLEGSGRNIVTADEVKRAVDFLALKQLTSNRTVG
ncbi:MAG: hypothetical protein M1608_14800, partial [Candidatus Omnitrophica bacterium]|nr:hypothetical protein [Candidatus Omnitrophota bacterium]